MAAEFHAELTDVTLALTTHAPGQRTLSAPGTPPALVTGTLRRSAVIVPAVSAGTRAVASCRVAAVYARIQEQGGTVSVQRKKVLANKRTGQVFGKSVRLPARPYMRPTRDLLVASGRLRARAGQAVALTVREAAAGG
jgi:phage gpG-like protein